MSIRTKAEGVYVGPGTDYFVRWDRLDTYPKLCEWLRHLSEKSWVTAEDLGNLVEATEEHFNWPQHRGA